MIQKISANERFHAQHEWLSTYHLFSFADYYDPENMNFGILRVFNDDTIDGKSGFGPHPHKDMEIVTIVLEGELTHQDSMGNTGTIKAGEVQYMSAGTGVTHAEMNTADEPVHLYQIWIEPQEKDLPPFYEQKDFSSVSNKNILLPVVSNNPSGKALRIRADVTIYTSHLEAGKTLTYPLPEHRGVFMYIQKGIIAVNDVICNSGDQIRIEGVKTLVLTATEEAMFVVLDVAMS